MDAVFSETLVIKVVEGMCVFSEHQAFHREQFATE